MNAEWIEFSVHEARRGRLVALEVGRDVPFIIERVYYVVQEDSSTVRAKHAHRYGEELLVIVSGTCTLTLCDGESTCDYVLDRPDRGLRIGPRQWEEFRLSKGAVLLALASTHYDPANYIEDYSLFLELIRSND